MIYWNFLPPDDLERLLALYIRVSHKTLLISKTFGIEGKKLLHPDDDFDALREFNKEYEGTTTPIEELLLEYQGLLRQYPDLADRLQTLPGRVFGGKEHPPPGTRAVFFCYRIPRPDKESLDEDGNPGWTERTGETRWYLSPVDGEKVLEDAPSIADFIRSTPETPRHCALEGKTLRRSAPPSRSTSRIPF